MKSRAPRSGRYIAAEAIAFKAVEATGRQKAK
jgi:hypothetical protein